MRQAEIGWLLDGGYFGFAGHTMLDQRAAMVALAGSIEDLAWCADRFANACGPSATALATCLRFPPFGSLVPKPHLQRTVGPVARRLVRRGARRSTAAREESR